MRRSEYARGKRAGDASKLRVGIAVSRYNADITESLLASARATLKEWHVPERSIDVIHVPGSFELPFGCRILLSRKRKPDCIIALGCIIKGETEHDRYIASAVANGLSALSLERGVPISFGVLTTNNLKQARVRSRGKTNKGMEAAEAALAMALLRTRTS
jgi:6,7-dimethyl-8-ribityllumazine synthase